MGERMTIDTMHGIIVPVVTPFDETEGVDEAALRGMVDDLIERGIHGLFPAGSQGEFFALTTDEKKRVIDIVLDQAAGRVFVMPNTGGITTRESIALTRYAQQAGADAASLITPFFIQPTQDELYHFFADIAASTDLPLLAYNNPGRTHLSIAPTTMARVAEACPTVVGIKDSSGDLTNTLEYVRLCPDGFHTFVGRDTLIYAAVSNGCAGAVAATANVVPELVVGIYEATMAGEYDRACALQRRLAPLRVAFGLGTFPVVVKEALALQGRLPDGRARRPIQPLGKKARTQLGNLLSEMGVL